MAVGLPEIGDGRKIGCQPLEQPDDLEMAVGLAFESSAGSNGVDISVEVEAEEIAGMAGRSAAGFRFDVRKAEVFEVQAVDLGIEESDRIFFGDIVRWHPA